MFTYSLIQGWSGIVFSGYASWCHCTVVYWAPLICFSAFSAQFGAQIFKPCSVSYHECMERIAKQQDQEGRSWPYSCMCLYSSHGKPLLEDSASHAHCLCGTFSESLRKMWASNIVLWTLNAEIILTTQGSAQIRANLQNYGPKFSEIRLCWFSELILEIVRILLSANFAWCWRSGVLESSVFFLWILNTIS